MGKDFKYIIVIIVVVLIGILACVITQKFDNDSIQTNGNVNNTVVEPENEVEIENIIQDENTVKEENVVENEIMENTVVETTTPVTTIYDSDSDIGTTNKKQEAIDLVKQTWGEDDTVSFRCDSITSDGKYIIAVVSLQTATVKNYFSVDLETKTVEVDY